MEMPKKAPDITISASRAFLKIDESGFSFDATIVFGQ